MFLDEFVEKLSLGESVLKIKIDSCEKDIHELEESMEILTVNKQMACAEYAVSYSNETKMLIEECKVELKKNKELKARKKTEKRKWNVQIGVEKQKRKGDELGIEHLLYNILEHFNIKKQHFHGGAMNGVCCRRLLENLDEIFVKIEIVLSDKMKCKTIGTMEKSHIDRTFGLFRDLFEVVDVVFYRLRMLDPTDDEIKQTKKAISVMKSLWDEIDLKQGPKLHILFDHTIIQVDLYAGIADLVEDFVEKYHQVGKKLDYLVARMSAQSFRQQELVKIRRQWLATNPHVHHQINTVHNKLKRKIKQQQPNSQFDGRSKLLSEIKKERKKIKRESTEMKPIFMVDV